MPSISFSTGVTITSAWLNDVNTFVYTLFAGATTATAARTALGLGTMSTQAASAVAITGGTITGITDLAVADGGTGSSTSAAARTALDVSQALNSLAAKAVPVGADKLHVYDIAGTADKSATIDNVISVGLPAGVVMDYAGSSAPTGWLECDGSAVSRATFAALFTNISTTWGAGDGSTTFNLPDYRGKVRVGRGTGTFTASGVNADVDTTADTLTVAANNTKWVTGQSVVFTLASGTITGLVSTTTYFVIRSSSTLIKLASSLANAQNGTPIDMTAKSSPVWTITATLTARTIGEVGGEEAHAMSSSELISHTHVPSFNNITGINAAGATGLAGGGSAAQTVSITIANTGGNAAANIMQPYGVGMTIIKT